MALSEDVFNRLDKLIREEEIPDNLKNIDKFKAASRNCAEGTPDGLMKKIHWLTQELVLTGRVASYLELEAKRAYNERVRVFNETRQSASRGDKEAAAQLAVTDLREAEARAESRAELWKKEYKSLQEHIYQLRLRARQDLDIHRAGAEGS